MPGQDDLYAHFTTTLHDRIEIVYLEPQQHTISVWLLLPVADGTVMVLHFEAVQLKHKLSVPDQLLVHRTPMTALAIQETLIPPATCFHIGYCDERLRAHGTQRNNL